MATAKTTMVFDARTSALNSKLDKSKRKAKGVADAFSRGQKNIDGMASRVGQMLGPTAALALAWKTIALDSERANRAVEDMKSGAAATARAFGITAGDPRAAARLQGASRRFRTEAGMSTEASGKLAFAAQSAFGGQTLGTKGTNILLMLQRSQQGALETLQAADRVIGASGGTMKDFERIVNQMVTAGLSSEATAADVGKAAAGALPFVEAAGGDIEQTLALLGGVKLDKIEVVRTGIRALARTLASQKAIDIGVTGDTFLDKTRSLASLNLSEAALGQFMESEAKAAFVPIIRQMGKVLALESTLRGDVAGALPSVEAAALRGPGVMADLTLRQQVALANESRGVDAAILQEARDEQFAVPFGSSFSRAIDSGKDSSFLQDINPLFHLSNILGIFVEDVAISLGHGSAEDAERLQREIESEGR